MLDYRVTLTILKYGDCTSLDGEHLELCIEVSSYRGFAVLNLLIGTKA